MSGDWSGALEKYARLPEPEKQIPPEVLLSATAETVTIFDGFEKAKYHFLIIPRDPFALDDDCTLASASLRSLSHLLGAPQPQALQVLKALEAAAAELKVWIEDEMRKSQGWAWPIQVGFHASESMRHVHLHVISSDLISPKLKNKKHYNSFHPDLGFFLHLHDVLEQVSTGKITCTKKSSKEYEEIFKLPLRSHYTGAEFKNIPKLKAHLEEEFAKRARAASSKRPRSPERVDVEGLKKQQKAK